MIRPNVSVADQRFEAARETSQGQGRGWDFSPARPRRYPVNLIRAVFVLGIGLLVLGALWSL